MSLFKKGFRSSFSQFQERRLRQKRFQERKQRSIFKRNIKRLFYALLVISFIYIVLIGYERWQFTYNSKTANAVLVNKKSDSYRVNEIGHEYVGHFYLTYKYKVNNKWYRTMVEVRYEELNEYFDVNPKVGDTVKIRYLQGNPKKSEIMKLN